MKSEEDLECPYCQGPMVLRMNGKTGEAFYGCRSFPKCKGTRDSQGRSIEQQREDHHTRANRGGWSRRYES